MSLLVATLAWTAGDAQARDSVASHSPVEVSPGVYLAAWSEYGSAPAAEASPSRRAATTSKDAAAEPSVVGGTRTSIRRWPWLAQLKFYGFGAKDPVRSQHCGGSLVAPRIIVTAAHCLTLGRPEFTFPPRDFGAVTGRSRLGGNGGQAHSVADYFWFVDADGQPLWDADVAAWDVAFLLLDSPSRQRTIKLAGADELALWAPGQRASTAGWGSTVPGLGDVDVDPSNRLLRARLEMLSDARCESTYGAILDPELMVCAAGVRRGVDACSGDSGGPLVANTAAGSRRLIGAVSFGAGCGVVSGVYSRLAQPPIREALVNGVRTVSGVDVLGAGAEPPRKFRFGSLRRDFSPGKTRLSVNVAGPGEVRLHRSAGVRGHVVYPESAGRVRLRLRPHGAARKRLRSGRRGGGVNVVARISFTPLLDDAQTHTERRVLKLRRR